MQPSDSAAVRRVTLTPSLRLYPLSQPLRFWRRGGEGRGENDRREG